MQAATADPGVVVAIVALGAVLVGAIGMYAIGRSLSRWREGFDVPAAGASSPEEVREEVRQHVVAANARRARRGKPPVDVEPEVERLLREHGGGL